MSGAQEAPSREVVVTPLHDVEWPTTGDDSLLQAQPTLDENYDSVQQWDDQLHSSQQHSQLSIEEFATIKHVDPCAGRPPVRTGAQGVAIGSKAGGGKGKRAAGVREVGKNHNDNDAEEPEEGKQQQQHVNKVVLEEHGKDVDSKPRAMRTEWDNVVVAVNLNEIAESSTGGRARGGGSGGDGEVTTPQSTK
jgi:hypothetical protein